jgi:plastocyanin
MKPTRSLREHRAPLTRGGPTVSRLREVRAFVVPMVVGLVAAACGSNAGAQGTAGGGTPTSPGSSSNGSLTIDGVVANNHGTDDASGKNAIELEADNDGGQYYFSPTVITGSAGQTIKLSVKNEGSVEHNLTIDSLHVDKDIEPGDEVTVTVRLPQGGVLAFHCEYHGKLGMVGEFTVGGYYP